MNRTIYTRNCQMCGVEMKNVASHKRYCAECMHKRIAKKQQKYRETNKDYLRRRFHQYYLEHREERIEYAKEYQRRKKK